MKKEAEDDLLAVAIEEYMTNLQSTKESILK